MGSTVFDMLAPYNENHPYKYTQNQFTHSCGELNFEGKKIYRSSNPRCDSEPQRISQGKRQSHTAITDSNILFVGMSEYYLWTLWFHTDSGTL